MTDTPAILGGAPLKTEPFPPYRTIGDEEKAAVMAVLDSGVLSGFYGSYDPKFYGGANVRGLEREWAQRFGTGHAVSMNSATSALMAAVGAAGIGPGDEVIVTPYSMSASASCVLFYNAIPVFADIDPVTYCLDPDSVAARITERTRAIVVVHLFGHPAEMDALTRLAREHDLILIEDAAQAPAATYRGELAGTIGDMGIYSLNCHKVIQTGEGGILVTDDDELALRAQLIRNHGEVVVGPMGVTEIANLIGANFRMTEIEAAIGREQLKKLDRLTEARVDLAHALTERLSDLPGLRPPQVQDDCRHVYYEYVLQLEAGHVLSARRLVAALVADGLEFFAGYMQPLYLQPVYQRRIGFGTRGCPFTCVHHNAEVSYDPGICPVVEEIDRRVLFTELCRPPLTEEDLDLISRSFHRVFMHAEEIASLPEAAFED